MVAAVRTRTRRRVASVRTRRKVASVASTAHASVALAATRRIK